jgi:hypothetical protein
MMDDECGEVGGMGTDDDNLSSRRNICPSVNVSNKKIPHNLTRARTEATGVGSLRLTAELLDSLDLTFT